MQRCSYRNPLFLVLGILLSCFTLYPAQFLGTHSFSGRDFLFYEFPVCVYVKQALLNGTIPLWNPANLLGIPLLAQLAPMVFYPPTLLYLLLPTAWGVSLFMFFHMAFGGLGMYYLVRRLTNCSYGAFVAGYLFGFGGFSLNLLTWPHIMASTSWLPWVVLAGYNWLSSPTWRTYSWLTLAGGLQLLTGTPETIIITWVCLGLVALSIDPFEWSLMRLIGAPIGAGCLAAVQLFPFLRFAHDCSRQQGAITNKWHVTWHSLIDFILPLHHAKMEGFGGTALADMPIYRSIYVGLAVISLAFIFVFKFRDKQLIILGVGSLLGLMLAAGLTLYLPVLKLTRYPCKFTYMFIFLIILISGIGLGRYRIKPKHLSIPVILGIVLFGLEWFNPGPNLVNAGCRVILGLGVFYCLLYRVPLLLTCSLFFLDVATHCPNMQISVPVQAMEALTAPISGTGRYFPNPQFEQLNLKDKNLEPATAAYFMLRDANLLTEAETIYGFFPMYLRANDNLLRALMQTSAQQHQHLLDMVGARYVCTDKGAWVTNSTALPFATIGKTPVTCTNPEVYWLATDYAKVVMLPMEAKELGSADSNAVVQVLARSAHTIELSTEANRPTWVVVSQTYYSLWHAKVNGQPVKIYPANGLLQAVPVPSGKSHVQLFYQDRMFELGLVVSVFTCVGLVLCLYSKP